MTQLAVANEELFEVSDCELHRNGPSYTLDTVRHFRRQLGPHFELFWLIGADSIAELPSWYKINELADECIITTAARPGYDPTKDIALLRRTLNEKQIETFTSHILDTPLINISSTHIRQRVIAGQPIGELVAKAVHEYIVKHHLYQQTPSGQ